MRMKEKWKPVYDIRPKTLYHTIVFQYFEFKKCHNKFSKLIIFSIIKQIILMINQLLSTKFGSGLLS